MSFEYNSPLSHKMRVLCNLTGSGTGPSGLSTIPRAGFGAVNAEDAADAVWNAVKAVFSSSVASFGTVLFELYASGAYVPLANYATGVTPTGTATNFAAAQLTNFFYGTNRGRFHLDCLGVVLEPADKWSSFGTAPASIQTLVTAFTLASTDSSPHAWARTRSGEFLLSWLASTLALNRKSRRRLGNL
jgi:hypothetical protein